MGYHLTDKERKKIIADYVVNNNYHETSRINDTTVTTVKRIVKKAESSVLRKITQKQKKNTQSTLEHMDTQHNTKKKLLTSILNAMNDKAANVDMFTNIKDLAIAYGVIVDKELKIVELNLKNEELKLKSLELDTARKIVIVDDLPKPKVIEAGELVD